MFRSHSCGEIRLDHVGQTVTLAGWVQRRRDLGGMSFIDLRDRYGITQLSFNELLDPERLAEARKLNREFVIQARGTVVERENKNPNMATGDIELRVHE